MFSEYNNQTLKNVACEIFSTIFLGKHVEFILLTIPNSAKNKVNKKIVGRLLSDWRNDHWNSYLYGQNGLIIS